MSAAVLEPTQNGWTDATSHTRDPRRPVVVALLGVWRPCPTCWGQGRIYEGWASETEARAWPNPRICGTCVGVGQVPSTEEGR